MYIWNWCGTTRICLLVSTFQKDLWRIPPIRMHVEHLPSWPLSHHRTCCKSSKKSSGKWKREEKSQRVFGLHFVQCPQHNLWIESNYSACDFVRNLVPIQRHILFLRGEPNSSADQTAKNPILSLDSRATFFLVGLPPPTVITLGARRPYEK